MGRSGGGRMVFPEDDELKILNAWRRDLSDGRRMWDERTILYMGLWREHNGYPGMLEKYIEYLPDAKEGRWWKK